MTFLPELLPPGLASSVSDRNGASGPRGGNLDQDAFFELMVAQLRNQDPLSPLQSNEFMSQVAQFSTVGGIRELQKTVGELAASLRSNQALQASTLVGREVLVAGSEGSLLAGRGIRGAIDLPRSTGGLTLSVFDPAGQLVRQVGLGAQEAGRVRFAWDGLRDNGSAAAPGRYSLRAAALVDGAPEALPTLIGARVESVTLASGSADPTLNLEGAGPVPMGQVREIL